MPIACMNWIQININARQLMTIHEIFSQESYKKGRIATEVLIL